MAAHIFISANRSEDLETFARQVFSSLGIANLQARESSNYIGGNYFHGTAIGFEFTIAHADEPELSADYVWLAIKSHVWIDECSFWDQMADFIARVLTIQGYDVVRPERFGLAGGRWIGYTLHDPNGSTRKASVVAEYL